MKRARVGLSTVAAALLVAFVPFVASAADEPCHDDCEDRLALGSGANLPYYGSYPLSGSDTPTRAVVVVHGTGRNVEGYYDSIINAGAQADTEVVAPYFQTDEDEPEDGDLTWTNGDETSWKDGGDSVEPEGISSFAAMDDVLETLADKKKFPNLKRVTLVGHSAGGQFVQRYAAGGHAPDTMDVRYVPANPSSYLYFDDKRPFSTDGCDEYNDYKYGLDNRNPYMSRSTDEQLIKRYTSRHVTYLLGEQDIHHDHGIDLDCPAMAQGDFRLQRGESYFETMKKSFPSAPHEKVLVPGVGHDNDAMFASDQGRKVIFGD